MSIESIQFALNERFAAPLADFYKRRIVFWQDEDREFEKLADELEIPGVKLIKLNGTNNFAVKKLLLHDDLTSNYLIYNPFAYSDQQDNWLRDIELFSEEFRADFISIQMSELNISPTPAMRKTLKLYSKFLDSKERVKNLKKMGREYNMPLQLHIDIMSVLAGLKSGSAQEIFIAVLAAEPDEDNNTVLNNIKKIGSIDAFWKLAQKYTGYIHEEGKPLGSFAAHVLLTALAQQMNTGALRGLERFISESNKAYCYGIVSEWRDREYNDDLFELCRNIENELKLASRFDKQDIETLLTADIFPAIHESVLKRFFSETSEHVVNVELMLKTVENRRTSGWYNRFADYYNCLYYIAKMQEFYQENAAGFHIVDPKAIWALYTESAYKMDSFYRHFHYAFGNSLKNSNVLLEDKLKHSAEYTEALYRNWYLKQLTDCWTNAISDDMAALGYVSEIAKQHDFYSRYVSPLAGKNARAFVIISDALRYEVAAELCENIIRNTKGTAKLESVQAIFPSITKFGMANLLPGRRLSLTETAAETIEVLVDGQRSNSTADREKILRAADPNSIAVQYTDLLNMKRAERRELMSGKNVIYIYHDTIDAIGDKFSTEKKVFEACEEATEEISNIIRIIINDMQGTDIFITADHGFLYTYSSVAESDKLSKTVFSGKVYEAGRRYAIIDSETSAEYLMPIRMEGEIDGMPVKGCTPFGTARIRISGGGENYVHGGVSLQEMVVPVIAFKNLRTTSKQYVEVSNAEITLLSERHKVSNLLFSLDFFQRQPVGGKVQPCVYSVYMTDDEGMIVSDKQTIIADKTSTSESERVFHVRFNLKAGAYDKNKIYRLVIANDTDIFEEVEFRIDIAFAGDFGFDL